MGHLRVRTSALCLQRCPELKIKFWGRRFGRQFICIRLASFLDLENIKSNIWTLTRANDQNSVLRKGLLLISILIKKNKTHFSFQKKKKNHFFFSKKKKKKKKKS